MRSWPEGWREEYTAIPSGFLYEQGKGSGVAVKKIAVANGSNFSITEEAAETERPQLALDHSGVMAGLAEQVTPTAIAAT